MAGIMYALLLFAIFVIAGFGIGFTASFFYYLFNKRPIKKFQYTEPVDQKAVINRETPLDSDIRKGIDGENALSNYNI